jgi:hypothetical protein
MKTGKRVILHGGCDDEWWSRTTWPRVFWNTWCNSAYVWSCGTRVGNRNSTGYLRPQLVSSLHNKDTTLVQVALKPLFHPVHTQTLNTSSSSSTLLCVYRLVLTWYVCMVIIKACYVLSNCSWILIGCWKQLVWPKLCIYIASKKDDTDQHGEEIQVKGYFLEEERIYYTPQTNATAYLRKFHSTVLSYPPSFFTTSSL